jgi:hypothetical protein
MKFFVPSTPAPIAKTKESRKIALFYGVLLVIFALSQLFSFDKFLDLIESFWLPGGRPASNFVAAFVVVAEIFALPFLFRMKLSPLMRIISMVLSWLVPLIWLKLSLWLLLTTNAVTNTGLLGADIQLMPGWWTVLISLSLGILAAWSSWGLWAKNLLLILLTQRMMKVLMKE